MLEVEQGPARKSAFAVSNLLVARPLQSKDLAKGGAFRSPNRDR